MSKGVVATAGRPVESQRVIKTPPYHFTLLGHDFSQNHHSPNMRNLYICGNAHVLDRLHQAMTSHKSHIFREFLDLGLPIASRWSVANFAKVTTGPRLPSSDGPRLRRATSSVSSSWPRRGGLEVDSGGDSSSAWNKIPHLPHPKWSSHNWREHLKEPWNMGLSQKKGYPLIWFTTSYLLSISSITSTFPSKSRLLTA